ncbi:hypothetical protein M3J09_012021 [Ascochyta lentis]
MALVYPLKPEMPSLTIEQWIHHLQTRFSFAKLSDSSDPYVKAMRTFQLFTNDVASALQDNNGIDADYIDRKMLHKIYDDLPSFFEDDEFREWVKDATLKHPHRRTPKQQQWLCIVGAQQQKPSKSKADLLHMILEVEDRASIQGEGAYDIKSLLTDPDALWFFRNKHGIKAAEGNEDDIGESCLICANDFDAGTHLPQRSPCGHYQCRKCFQGSLKYVSAAYNCAFCRACLICGDQACKHHIIPQNDALPHPLQDFLRTGHYLCRDSCTAMEPLCGLSPRRYWELREATREVRSSLTKMLWFLTHDLTPEQRSYVERDREALYSLLVRHVELAQADHSYDKVEEEQAKALEQSDFLA